MQIGKTIRKYRKEKGMTQEEMANRLGVTTPAVMLNRKLNTSKNKIKLQNKIINRWNIMPL